MNKNIFFYIAIAVGLLTVSACAGNILEDVTSPEETAIKLAKMCVVVDEEASGLKMSAQEAISSWEKEPQFTPLGWEAIDVDESIYFVSFNYRVNNINQVWAFHVIPEGGIVERIELGDDGLDGYRYMTRIIKTSSYPRKELEARLEKVLKRLIFQ